MTFAQIERILGVALPNSARRYRPWWANEAAGTHVHRGVVSTQVGGTANVELNAGTVEFIR